MGEGDREAGVGQAEGSGPMAMAVLLPFPVVFLLPALPNASYPTDTTVCDWGVQTGVVPATHPRLLLII